MSFGKRWNNQVLWLYIFVILAVFFSLKVLYSTLRKDPSYIKSKQEQLDCILYYYIKEVAIDIRLSIAKSLLSTDNR